MTRKECLEQAMGCVLKDRNNEYGKPEDSFGVIANFWSVYLGRKVYPHDVAMMMSLLKIARIKGNKGYADGYIDLAGYAACGAECAMPECDAEPIFRPGDKVQFCQFPHADVWLDGIVERVEGGHCFIRRSNGVEVSAPKRLIRRPCAEGCEDLVFNEARMRESMPGIVPQDGPSGFDAPRTKEELYDRIVANNPATFGCAHKPTGEELAEMAEEGAHG